MVEFASHTHPGRVHDDNEDTIGADPVRCRWLVADGMGGHASGEVASAIVKETILREVDLPLTDAVRAAHRAVVAEAEASDGRYRGMGSTVVALALIDGQAEVVWVGDSRAYLWRKGDIRRISRDHSFVELLRDSKGVTESEIRTHPDRHLVTQTLGHGDPVPSSVHLDLRAHDWLILCSDGLTDELDDQEIAALLKRSTAPGEAVVQLVDAALARGGHDNVTVVVLEVSDADLPRQWRQRLRDLRGRAWYPALLGVIGALIVGALVLFSFRST